MPKPTVLIVEDDAITRFMMSEICDRLGYACSLASTGAQCLDMVKSDPHCAAVVLMDIHMPELSGVDACAGLRSLSLPGPRPRIIAVTADEFWQDRRHTKAAGFDGVLCKPISIEKIRRVLEDAAASDARSAP